MARVLERHGWAGVTTNAIAKEADTGVGTVYDYFPNKEAILQALLERYQRRLETVVLAAVRESASTSRRDVGALVAAGVRAFAYFYRDEPGYGALWLGSQLAEPLLSTGEAWGSQFSQLLSPLLCEFTGLAAQEGELVVLAMVHATSAVITAGLKRPEPQRSLLIEEAVLLAQVYVKARARDA